MTRRLVSLALAGAALVAPAAARAQFVSLTCGGDRTQQIEAVTFVGNHTFSSAELALHVATTPSDWGQRNKWTRWAKIFGTKRCVDPSHSLVTKDRDALVNYYVNQGFPDVKVDANIQTEPGRHDRVDVIFIIQSEGQPTLVRKFSITGLPNRNGADPRYGVDTESVIANLFTRLPHDGSAGRDTARFSFARLFADYDSIGVRLANDGYPLAGLAFKVDTVGAHLRDVRFIVTAGPPVRFGVVRPQVDPFPGKAQQISNHSVLGVLGFGSGDPFSNTALSQARRNLYNLGTFSVVEAPILDTLRTRVDSTVDVVLPVRENRVHSFEPEVGWTTLDCFHVRGQYTDHAFLHTTRVLTVSGNASKLGWAKPFDSAFVQRNHICNLSDDVIGSDTLNYNVTASVQQPGAFAGWTVPTASVYREVQGGYKAYLHTTLLGGALTMDRALGVGQAVQAGYNIEYGHTSAQPAVECFVFHACDAQAQDQLSSGKNNRLGVFSTSYSREGRDDPLEPTKGTILRGEFRMSNKVLGSDSGLSFYKGVGDVTLYHRLFGSNTLALRLRLGTVAGGASTDTSGVAHLPPPQERLYAGGAASVRGYQQNEVGQLIYVVDARPTDSLHLGSTPRVIPVGGNRMVVANVDYRIPGLFGLFPRGLQTVLFYDAGAVWTRENDTLHLGQQLKLTPGIGLRYASPIGLIQVNVGYNPYPRPNGPLFYNPGVSSNFQLYCVSTSTGAFLATDSAITALTGKGQSSAANCPSTFAPTLSKVFIRQLQFTFSIGPDY